MPRKKIHARASDKKPAVVAKPDVVDEKQIELKFEDVPNPDIDKDEVTEYVDFGTEPFTAKSIELVAAKAEDVTINLNGPEVVEERVPYTELTFKAKPQEPIENVSEETESILKLADKIEEILVNHKTLWADLHPALVLVLDRVQEHFKNEETTLNFALKALSVKKVEDIGSAFGSSNKRATIVDIINSTGLSFSAEFKAEARLLAI